MKKNPNCYKCPINVDCEELELWDEGIVDCEFYVNSYRHRPPHGQEESEFDEIADECYVPEFWKD